MPDSTLKMEPANEQLTWLLEKRQAADNTAEREALLNQRSFDTAMEIVRSRHEDTLGTLTSIAESRQAELLGDEGRFNGEASEAVFAHFGRLFASLEALMTRELGRRILEAGEDLEEGSVVPIFIKWLEPASKESDGAPVRDRINQALIIVDPANSPFSVRSTETDLGKDGSGIESTVRSRLYIRGFEAGDEPPRHSGSSIKSTTGYFLLDERMTPHIHGSDIGGGYESPRSGALSDGMTEDGESLDDDVTRLEICVGWDEISAAVNSTPDVDAKIDEIDRLNRIIDDLATLPADKMPVGFMPAKGTVFAKVRDNKETQRESEKQLRDELQN
ncbi:hypothetical protein KBC31_03385 [Candidatus Saccharibacteria bacterium]|nr:hypothetical protein [Candidatus Saccharibacteria bacterium]